MDSIKGLNNFRTLAREFDLLPTEVSAIVIGSGARIAEHLPIKIIEPDDMPMIEPMLIRLREYKARRRSMSA